MTGIEMTDSALTVRIFFNLTDAESFKLGKFRGKFTPDSAMFTSRLQRRSCEMVTLSGTTRGAEFHTGTSYQVSGRFADEKWPPIVDEIVAAGRAAVGERLGDAS